MLYIDEFALLVQAVDSANVRVFPTSCNLETFVTKLNIFDRCFFRSFQLDCSLLCSNIIDIQETVGQSNRQNQSIRVELSNFYGGIFLNFY